MPISQTEGYFENLYYCFLEEPMRFLYDHITVEGKRHLRAIVVNMNMSMI